MRSTRRAASLSCQVWSRLAVVPSVTLPPKPGEPAIPVSDGEPVSSCLAPVTPDLSLRTEIISRRAASHRPTPCAMAGIAQLKRRRLTIAAGMASSIVAAIVINRDAITRPSPIKVERYPL